MMPQPNTQAWKNQIQKEQRSQIFKAVMSNMKKNPALSKIDEQTLTAYTLRKMSDYWKESTSKEEFLQHVSRLADPKAVTTLSTNQVDPHQPTMLAHGQVPTTSSNPVAQVQVPNFDYWEKIEQFKPYAENIKGFADTFTQKRNELRQLQKMKPLEMNSPENLQKIEKSLTKYDALVKQFHKVYDVVTGKTAPRTFTPTTYDLQMLSSIEQQLQKQMKVGMVPTMVQKQIPQQPIQVQSQIQTQVPNVPIVVQAQQQEIKPIPSTSTSTIIEIPSNTPPQQQQQHQEATQPTVKDPTQRLIGVLVGMEREFPRDLRSSLGRIQDKMDVFTEQQDFFDQIHTFEKSSTTTLTTSPQPLISSEPIYTTTSIASKKRKLPLTKCQEYESAVDLKQLHQSLLNGTKITDFSIQGIMVSPIIHLKASGHDRNQFEIKICIHSSLCYIPPLVLSICLTDHDDGHDVMNMVAHQSKFNSGLVDEMNDIFSGAKALFLYTVNNKKSRSGVVRVPFVIKTWLTCVKQVLTEQTESDGVIE
ncbi:hflD [Acrasis kona]|uniref:HflD n=1 Tax=Acrasis kona TaxID=1008807 RepID=A0AAW2YVJ9_9EUKA